MDALGTIVSLLKPQAIGAKVVHGSGRWGVRYPAVGHPSFALVLKGPCWLAVDGTPPTVLESGDFVFFPAMPAFTLASDRKVRPVSVKPVPADDRVEEVFHGDATLNPSASLLGGYFAFDPTNAPMLLDFLPGMLHIRATEPAMAGMAPLVALIQREAGQKLAGRALVLSRLVEVLLVEALRCAPVGMDSGGLLAGLHDARLAMALHGIHTQTAHQWSLDLLAREAAMSRSAFAERFARVMGTTPMNYLLQWRIAVAKDMLGREQASVGEAALAVGYESASAFSTAFSRETGRSPREFIGAGRRHG